MNSKKSTVDAVLESLEKFFSGEPKDIAAAIKKDHEALRSFMDLLKDTDADMSERRRAYTSFASLLKSHSYVEEHVVYKMMEKLSGREMHIKIEEGYVEHQLGTDLMKRIAKCKRPLEWSAHANVLSEIMEHHLKEEERDLLPLIQKTASKKQNQIMLDEFIKERRSTQRKVNPKNAGVLK